jgi:DNA-binding transcriptional LysR family regulator
LPRSQQSNWEKEENPDKLPLSVDDDKSPSAVLLIMDFDQLETFLEVARLSSFSRAAERRFRTQPAISAQIRALEEEVGARLLDRSGGKVAVTGPGKVFQKYAEETLEQRRVVLIALAEMYRVPRGEIVVSAMRARARTSCLSWDLRRHRRLAGPGVRTAPFI